MDALPGVLEKAAIKTACRGSWCSIPAVICVQTIEKGCFLYGRDRRKPLREPTCMDGVRWKLAIKPERMTNLPMPMILWQRYQDGQEGLLIEKIPADNAFCGGSFHSRHRSWEKAFQEPQRIRKGYTCRQIRMRRYSIRFGIVVLYQ